MELQELHSDDYKKFREIYTKLRYTYVHKLLNGYSNLTAKAWAFNLLSEYELSFFYEVMKLKGLTMYNCLSLKDEEIK